MEGNFCCGLTEKLKQTSKWRKLKQNILNRHQELIQITQNKISGTNQN